ncbi:MAG: MFS transporter [Micropepsaceae bacterium]
MSAGTQQTKIPPRAVAAVVIGNWLEFYDFIVFTFFAVMISKAFFPTELMAAGLSQSEAEFMGLLAALATFWAGFFTRPLGALIIGAYGDRAGRKAAMTLTIMLMALGTGIVALTPTYAQIGIWAPVILIIGRLIQGFSCGGEVGAATSYLLESAPANRRASQTAWQGTSQQFAGVAGSGLGLILAATLTEQQLYDWGWRVAFLVGLLIAPVGLYIRAMLPETIEKHEAHESSAAVLSTLFTKHWWPILLGVLCIVGPTISTYVSGYMTTYAMKTLGHPADLSMLLTMVGYIAGIAGVPLGAWLADRIGFRTSVIIPRVIFLLVVMQAYVLITAKGSTVETLLLVNAGLNFLLALSYGGLYVLLTEAFPKSVRSAGLSIAYAISVTVFGGSTQLVLAWLIETLKDPLVPAWYQIGANVVSLIAIMLIGMRRVQQGAPQSA